MESPIHMSLNFQLSFPNVNSYQERESKKADGRKQNRGPAFKSAVPLELLQVWRFSFSTLKVHKFHANLVNITLEYFFLRRTSLG